MKIALINPPYEKLVFRCGYCSNFAKSNYYWPPIDLLVQSGFLHRGGHEVRVFDFNVMGTPLEKAAEDVRDFAPDGMFVLIGSGSWKSDIAFVERLKHAAPKSRVAVGGAVLLYRAADFIERFPFIDGVLMDFTQDVLATFFGGNDNVSCISARENGKPVVRTPQWDRKLSFPPGRHELFPLDRYRNPHNDKRFTVLLTSFGCQYSCTYCNATDIPFRYRAVDEIMEELRYIYSLGIREVKFRDLNFVSKVSRTRDLCEAIIASGMAFGWHATTRADPLNEDLLLLMKRAGCHSLHMGVESGSEELLQRYEKRVNLERIKASFWLCKKIGIRTLGTFIIGLPGETPASIQKTIAFAKELKCDIASFNIATALYGTGLRKECLDKGYIEQTGEVDELEVSFKASTITTPQLSPAEVQAWHRRAMISFYLRPGYVWDQITHRSFSELIGFARMGMPVLRGIFGGH